MPYITTNLAKMIANKQNISEKEAIIKLYEFLRVEEII